MSTLVSPQPSALLTFLKPNHFHKTIFGLGFVLALAMATTSCATLDPMSGQSIKPIAISASVPMATVGSSYHASVSVSGGTAPYAFAAKAG